MDIEVEVLSSNYSVSLGTAQTIEVTSQAATSMAPISFHDITDFNDSNKQNQYVIMYDAVSQKYVLVNPDQVLSASAATEPIQQGLPADFINELDVQLDNKINLDAGGF